jgi:hypothetical protein
MPNSNVALESVGVRTGTVMVQFYPSELGQMPDLAVNDFPEDTRNASHTATWYIQNNRSHK